MQNICRQLVWFVWYGNFLPAAFYITLFFFGRSDRTRADHRSGPLVFGNIIGLLEKTGSETILLNYRALCNDDTQPSKYNVHDLFLFNGCVLYHPIIQKDNDPKLSLFGHFHRICRSIDRILVVCRRNGT